MTRVRNREGHTRAKQVTMCGSCNTMAGVTLTPWNKTLGTVYPKVTPHKRGGVRCPGSMLTVHPNTVMAP